MTCNPKSDGTWLHRFVGKLRGLPGFGRVYLAVARASGLPALVQVYTARQQPLPGGLELLVSTGESPRHLTVEVRRGAGEALVHALEDGANLLGAALSRPEAVQHLARPAPVRPLVRRASWRSWALAGTGAALAAGLALCLLSHHESGLPEQFAVDQELPEAPAQSLTFADLAWADEPVRFRVPDKPLKGQDRPPCASPSFEVNGGCWLKLDAKVPCPKGSAEHKGGCYVPVGGGKQLPMSLDRARP